MQHLIKTSWVARLLGISEAAVRKMADDGRLPVAAKLADGTRLFSPESISTYAQRLQRNGVTPAPTA